MNKLVMLLAHLSLNHIELSQKTFLGSQDHVKLLAIKHLYLSTIIKDFCSSIFGYFYFLYMSLKQVVVQKVDIDYLFLWLVDNLA